MFPDFTIHILCPYCHKGEILADRRAKVKISVVCPICLNRFVADLYELDAYRPMEVSLVGAKDLPLKCPCPCPDCHGQTWATGKADAHISIKCSKRFHYGYSRYYIVDLLTGRTWSGFPMRKAI